MAEDAQGFTTPSSLGFTDYGGDIDDNLKMRLFPIFELKQAYSGVGTSGVILERIFGVSNARYLVGPNFQQMPGVIWSACLGSPIGIPEGAGFDSPSNYPKVPTIRGWIQHYLIGQMNATATHIYFHRSANNWGGLCTYIDITEGSILGREFDVYETLSLLLGSRPTFSVMEEEAAKREIQDGIVEALNWLIGRIPQGHRASLGMIMVYSLYAIFRRFKHRGANWSEEPAAAGAKAEYHDYNLRVYFIKRRGRFVYDLTERGATKIPMGEMPAKEEERRNGAIVRADERNLSPQFWLAMSQYYRLMSCWMAPATLAFQAGGQEFRIHLKTLRRFITRDAHACTTSSISAAYDAAFFNESAAAGRGRTVLLGTDAWYKKMHHAKFYTQEGTWARGKPASLYNSFGILAGVCWYFNPNMNEVFCNYPIFRLPFDILRETTRRGVTYKIPTLLNAKDEDNFIGSDAFFTYGVDEYILSEFVAQHYNIPERWEEMNLLIFKIHWLDQIYKSNSGTQTWEYFPILIQTLFDSITSRAWAPTTPFQQFLKQGFAQYKNNFFQTLFGNILSGEIYTMNLSDIDIYRNTALNQCLLDFEPFFPRLITRGVNGSITSYDRDCLLRYFHRLDRPFYWKPTDGTHILSPRTTGEAPIVPVPNNIDDAVTNLRFVLRNPIDRACGTGLCTSDNISDARSGTCRATAGGRRKQRKTRRNTKKVSKTRKH